MCFIFNLDYTVCFHLDISINFIHSEFCGLLDISEYKRNYQFNIHSDYYSVSSV